MRKHTRQLWDMVNYGCGTWLGYMIRFTNQLYFYSYHRTWNRSINWEIAIIHFSWAHGFVCKPILRYGKLWFDKVIFGTSVIAIKMIISFDRSTMLVTICPEFFGWALMFDLFLKNIILEHCMMINNGQFWPRTLFQQSFLSPITDFQLVHVETDAVPSSRLWIACQATGFPVVQRVHGQVVERSSARFGRLLGTLKICRGQNLKNM